MSKQENEQYELKVGKPKIGIVGLGMVGEPLRRYFEEEKKYKRGKNLFCYDVDPKKQYSDDVRKAQVIFVCVPTPRNADGSCNTNIVESVIREYTASNKVFVIKSTVEPGTTERLARRYRTALLFNPEFLTEARAWEDTIHPDRQIVAATMRAQAYAKEILTMLPLGSFSSPGVLGTYDFYRIDATEAEIGKYASNIFGALKVTFSNIIADFCTAIEYALAHEGLKTTVRYDPAVRRMIASDARIGSAWLDVYQGHYRGFAGYCFPKDLIAFIFMGEKMLKTLPKKFPHYRTLEKGIIFLKSMREYNRALLKSQGFAEDDVSLHDSELSQKIETIKRARRSKKE